MPACHRLAEADCPDGCWQDVCDPQSGPPPGGTFSVHSTNVAQILNGVETCLRTVRITSKSVKRVGANEADGGSRERRTGHRRAPRRKLIEYMAAGKWARLWNEADGSG